MMYVQAVCARCGQPLAVYVDHVAPRLDGTGDLYLTVGGDGITSAQALCKNIQVCDEYRIEHAPAP